MNHTSQHGSWGPARGRTSINMCTLILKGLLLGFSSILQEEPPTGVGGGGCDPETWDFVLVLLLKATTCHLASVFSKMEFEGVDSFSGRGGLQGAHIAHRAACGRKNMLEVGTNGPALLGPKPPRLTGLTRQEKASPSC